MTDNRIVLLLTSLLACCVFSASASAELITYGSDLTAPANTVEPEGGSHPAYGGAWNGADTAFWNLGLATGGQAIAPADGQIVEFRVKGVGLRGPNQPANPRALVHFQTLRPQPDGSVKVILTSGETDWPLDSPQGDTQRITTVQPLNHCVKAGDYVAFNTWGGHEWRWANYGGIPLQIFSRVPGSSLAWYEADNGTNNGAQFAGRTRPDVELLLQAVLATGEDATDICPGGYKEHIYEGLQMERQSATLRVNEGVVRVRASCPGPAYGSCEGNLRLEANLGGTDVKLGDKNFELQPATTTNIVVPVSMDNIAMVQAEGSVNARAVADSHDNPRKADQNDVPVQTKTTDATVRITPDKAGSVAACETARTAETRARRVLAKAKKRQKRARSRRQKKAAAKKVAKARKNALRTTAVRRRACS
jgi:hypothetical protein